MRAWFAGDFEGCLGLCDRVRPSDVDMVSQLALLRARALLRLGRPHEAVAVVSGVFIAHGTLDASLTARMLLGQAYVRLGEYERGLSVLEEAYRGADAAHPTVRSEVALNVGLGYYGLGKLDEADAALQLVSDRADIVHARALEYRGWVALARFDFAAATRLFIEALRRLDACRHYDRFLEANAIQAVAILAAERFDRTAWIFAEPRAERFDWSAEGLAQPRFGIAISGSMLFEADGRIADALLAAREAESAAPSPAYALVAQVRRAAVLRAVDERFAHADLVGAVRRELDRLDVAALHGDARDLPFALAEEVAYAGDVPGARALVKRCDDLPQPSGVTVAPGDPRESARRVFLEAVIADAAGDQREAHAHYQRAFQLYHRLGWERRALQAALRLGELTGQTYLLEYADRTLRKLSAGSPFRTRRNHPVLADPDVAGLSRTERAVLMMLCDGKTTVEIAQARARSKQTIRNTISRILTSFGVADRPALLRECLRRGIIAHSR